MSSIRATQLFRTARTIPRVRAYSTPTPQGQPKQPLEQHNAARAGKAGSSNAFVAMTLAAVFAGGVFFFGDDLKSYFSGGLAAGDESVVSKQKDGKMVSVFQKKE